MAIPRQLPNAITIVRILCAPVFLWMLLADGGADGALRWWAAVLFIVAIATDGVDGYLARKHDIVSDLGKLLDPIADKVLTGFAFLGLSILAELPWWVTIVVLVREIGITVYRFLVVSDHVLAAAWMGKLKTVAQGVALALALLPLWTLVGEWIWWVNVVTMTIAVILTIASGIDYVVTEIRAAREAAGRAVTARAASVLQALVGRGWTIAVAESLTGGQVVSTLVDVPGASASVRGGVVAYATDVKRDVLGVDAALLAAEGAVDPDVARQMAESVRRVLNADVGVATTGVAGPDPQDGKPVGTVFVAVATPDGVQVWRHAFAGDRAAIRRQATDAALDACLTQL